MKQIVYIRTVGTTGIAWLCLVHWYYRPRTLRLQSQEVQKRLNLIDEELFIKVKLKKATNKKHGKSINKEIKKENKKESNLEYQKYLDTLQKELRNKNKII